jgi:hypothetical protein
MCVAADRAATAFAAGATLRRMRASTRLEEIGGCSGNFTAQCGSIALRAVLRRGVDAAPDDRHGPVTPFCSK